MGIFKRSTAPNNSSSQEKKDSTAIGWIEGIVEAEFRNGLFALQEGEHGKYFTFTIVETHDQGGTIRGQDPFWSRTGQEPSEVQSIGWNEIDWVRLKDRTSYSEVVQDFHWEVFGGSNDPQLISGHLKLGIDDDWFFSLIGDEQRSSAEWLELFRDAGVKILDPQ
jgi:hypothetical protein